MRSASANEIAITAIIKSSTKKVARKNRLHRLSEKVKFSTSFCVLVLFVQETQKKQIWSQISNQNTFNVFAFELKSL